MERERKKMWLCHLGFFFFICWRSMNHSHILGTFDLYTFTATIPSFWDSAHTSRRLPCPLAKATSADLRFAALDLANGRGRWRNACAWVGGRGSKSQSYQSTMWKYLWHLIAAKDDRDITCFFLYISLLYVQFSDYRFEQLVAVLGIR